MDPNDFLSDEELDAVKAELEVPDFYFEDAPGGFSAQRECWGAGIKATTLDVKPNEADNAVLRLNIGLVEGTKRCQILIEGELEGWYFELSGPPQSSYEEAVASFIDHIRKLEGFGFEHGVIEDD